MKPPENLYAENPPTVNHPSHLESLDFVWYVTRLLSLRCAALCHCAPDGAIDSHPVNPVSR